MFTPDLIIDTIQNSKKQFVNTFVTDKSVAAALNEFVDAQTAYTKQAAKAGTEMLSKLSDVAIKNVYTK